MTHANYTYVALGLQVVVGFPLVWAALVVIARARVPIARAITVFALFLLSGLAGFAVAFLLGRLWFSAIPSQATLLPASVFLPTIIVFALAVFAFHCAILHRFVLAPRQVAMLAVLLLWVGWYAIGSFAIRTGAAILL